MAFCGCGSSGNPGRNSNSRRESGWANEEGEGRKCRWKVEACDEKQEQAVGDGVECVSSVVETD